MIDFACKHFELDEIIRCGFGLTKGELRLLYSLESTEWQSAEDLAGTLGLSTSSMQRSLKRLTEKGIVARRQMNLSSGGYQFEYRLHTKEHLRDVLGSIIDEWAKGAKRELKQW